MNAGRNSDGGNFSEIDHIAIAVPDLEAAVSLFRDQFGADISSPVTIAEQSIRMAYAQFGNVRIELMQPLGDDTPVGRFLARNPRGGLHHICIAATDVNAAFDTLQTSDLRVVGAPRKGFHGRPLFFLHPKSTLGTLIEIEQAGDEHTGQEPKARRSP